MTTPNKLHFSPAVAACAAATLLLHALVMTQYGWFRDEFYYLACAARLDWGYVDHPPLVAVLTAAVTRLLGDSLVALRILPAAAHAGVVLLAGWMAREFGARTFGQTVAAAAVAVTPVLLALSHIMSMNSLDMLFWTLCSAVLARAIARDDPRGWLVFGLIAGIAFQNKISILFLGAGLAAGILVAGPRHHLRTRWPWLGGMTALLIALPHLIWQHANGWPTLEFMRRAQEVKNVAMPPAEFLAEQVLQNNPLAAPLWIAGLMWLLMAPVARRWRLFGLAYLVILAVFLRTAAKPYYLAPFYPVLFAAGGAAIERWSEPLGRAAKTTTRAAVLLLVLAGGIIGAPLAIPVLPVETYVRYQDALGLKPSVGEQHDMGPLPQFYADMFGWQELVEEVTTAAARLTPAERAEAVIYVQNYGQAGAIEHLGRGRGLPPVVAGHNSYFLWGPVRPHTRTLIIVGGLAEEHDECGSLEQTGRVHQPLAMPYENGKAIFVCRQLSQPLGALWPSVKHFE